MMQIPCQWSQYKSIPPRLLTESSLKSSKSAPLDKPTSLGVNEITYVWFNSEANRLLGSVLKALITSWDSTTEGRQHINKHYTFCLIQWHICNFLHWLILISGTLYLQVIGIRLLPSGLWHGITISPCTLSHALPFILSCPLDEVKWSLRGGGVLPIP